jgi:hypothetical protein
MKMHSEFVFAVWIQPTCEDKNTKRFYPVASQETLANNLLRM